MKATAADGTEYIICDRCKKVCNAVANMQSEWLTWCSKDYCPGDCAFWANQASLWAIRPAILRWIVSKRLLRQRMRHSHMRGSRRLQPVPIDINVTAGDVDTSCKVHVMLNKEQLNDLPLSWIRKGINSRVCNGEVAYIYMHPNGDVKYRCSRHRWELKRRKTQWEEHVALWMQR